MRLLRRAFRAVVLTILLILCAALFYLLVIMGDTLGGDAVAKTENTPVPHAAMPQPRLTFAADNLRMAEAFFSAPMLRLSQASGWQLKEAVVTDAASSGVDVAVREIRLEYVNLASSATVFVSSLSSSDALHELPSRGFFTTIDQDISLLGHRSVLMRNGDTLHVHLQKGGILYQIEGSVDIDTLRQAASSAEV